MNGAAMDCRQDRALRTQHRDNSGLHSPGYHQHTDRPHRQISHLQHSKAMNYHSLSDQYLGDVEHDDSSRRLSHENMWDPRPKTGKMWSREPLELPVPQFEIDENYVGEPPDRRGKIVENSKTLDLDTRIDLLIKSKALAVMHPIFSELDESEKSCDESDSELFENKPKRRASIKQRHRSSSSEDRVQWFQTADDPETPLSRPPSPFLSRATYLFWFNKAIELKQQAKEQEQALLEKATKRLSQDNFSTGKINRTENRNPQKRPLSKSLLDEICKELKKVVKQEFIAEVLENSVFTTLDNWWDEQKQSGQEIKDIKSPELHSTKEIDNCRVTNKSEQCASSTCNNATTFEATSSNSSTFPKCQLSEIGIHHKNIHFSSNRKQNSSYGDMELENKEKGAAERSLLPYNKLIVGTKECNNSVEEGNVCDVPNSKESRSTERKCHKRESVSNVENYQTCDSGLLSPTLENDLTAEGDNCKEIVISILNTIINNVEEYTAKRCDLLNGKPCEEESSCTTKLITTAEEINY